MSTQIPFKSILITGGAGFVGSNLAVLLKRDFPDVGIIAVDNLRRRGSELNLARLRQAGAVFCHGDVRCTEDVSDWPQFDLLIDCSAEPSVQAGLTGSPAPVLNHNLVGTLNCVEAVRRRNAAMLFLSTSRVYPISRINNLRFEERQDRFQWTLGESVPGFSEHGIAEEFPLDGVRSLYGATKLAAELVLQEFAFSFKVPVLINRCGVLAGPWQMGKVDQGVVTLWAARHVFDRPLRYIGFGGEGKQVRDVLHVDDLYHLLVRQMMDLSHWDGSVFNVGGGPEVASSLRELTATCQELTGKCVAIDPEPATSPVDLRIYITDSRKAKAVFQWRPQKTVPEILADVLSWLRCYERELRPVLA